MYISKSSKQGSQIVYAHFFELNRSSLLNIIFQLFRKAVGVVLKDGDGHSEFRMAIFIGKIFLRCQSSFYLSLPYSVQGITSDAFFLLLIRIFSNLQTILNLEVILVRVGTPLSAQPSTVRYGGRSRFTSGTSLHTPVLFINLDNEVHMQNTKVQSVQYKARKLYRGRNNMHLIHVPCILDYWSTLYCRIYMMFIKCCGFSFK